MLLGAVVGVVLGMLIGHFTALSEAPVEHVAVRARNPGGRLSQQLRTAPPAFAIVAVIGCCCWLQNTAVARFIGAGETERHAAFLCLLVKH